MGICMSRWTEQFKSHAFHSVWNELKDDLDSAIVDDEIILTSVQELARLKKVISYTDELLNSIDPELVPLTTWDTFNNQATPCGAQIASYNSNRNIGHIQNANAHADNLLTYIRPYMIAQGKGKAILNNSFVEYTKTIEKYISSFQTKANELLNSINVNDVESNNIKVKLEAIESKVDTFTIKLFGVDTDTEDSIESKVNKAFDSIESHHASITEFHDELLIDAPKKPSIKTSISDALEEVNEDKVQILESINEAETDLKELQSFYLKIFGKLNDDDERVGGLSSEITSSLSVLRELEASNKNRYEALTEQIERLLPGARVCKESVNNSV